MKKPVKVVFGIDMETDVGSWTPFYEGLVRGTPRLLKLFAAKGVKVTTYWVAEAARKHPEVLRDVQSAGHEIGTHSLTHETVGQPLFDIPGIYPLLPHEVRPRIELATRIVADTAGAQPVSWRCPRLFGGTAVTNALEDLGYTSDATYPMYFYEKRRYPYHPSRTDWTKPGRSRLIEIVQFADMGLRSRDPHGRDRDQWPLYRTTSARQFAPHITSFLRYIEARDTKDTSAWPAVLCFYFHPWEFWKMPQGAIHYGEGAVLPDPFLVKGCGAYCLKQVGLLIDWLKSIGGEFQTAAECADEWRARLGERA